MQLVTPSRIGEEPQTKRHKTAKDAKTTHEYSSLTTFQNIYFWFIVIGVCRRRWTLKLSGGSTLKIFVTTGQALICLCPDEIMQSPQNNGVSPKPSITNWMIFNEGRHVSSRRRPTYWRGCWGGAIGGRQTFYIYI